MIPRIHASAAVAAFVNLLVYAAAGLAPPSAPAPADFDLPFAARPGESDRTVAERVLRLLGLSLAMPVHDFNVAYDPAGRLILDFYHANGRHVVTILPGHMHVQATRAPLGKYLSTLHVTTAAFHSGDWRMQLWAWYNEFAMWALIVMLATGVWMALTRRATKGTTRSIHRIAALFSIPVLAIFAASAVQMAHRTWWSAGPVTRALNAIHRARGFALAPVAATLLLVLAASGLWLWFQDRRPGVALAGVGALVSGGLILWMRAG